MKSRKMDSLDVDVKQEIKDEDIEFKEIKSFDEVNVKKEIKEGLVVQNGLAIIDQPDLFVKNEIQDDLKPDIEIKEEVHVPKSDSTDDNIIIKKTCPAFCDLCQVTLHSDIAEHVNGKKHKKKLESLEKTEKNEINSTNFIITDPTQMPFYCAQCQVAYRSQQTLDLHLMKIHKIPCPAFCTLCQVSVFFNAEHMNGKKHKKKLKSQEKESSTVDKMNSSNFIRIDPTKSHLYCDLCFHRHLNGKQHKNRMFQREVYGIKKLDNKVMKAMAVDNSDKEQVDVANDQMLESVIAQIRDLFPELGEGFLAQCLAYFDSNTERVINALLEDNLPPHLANLDRALAKPSQPPSNVDQNQGSLLKGIDNKTVRRKCVSIWFFSQ